MGDGPGQGPRGTRGREAAMGETIFVGACPGKKWWGPVVLDAAPKPASDLETLRERPLPTVAGVRSASLTNHFPTRHDNGRIDDGGDQRPAKGTNMARSKPSARDALRKLREQREELEAKEARLRDEAAVELGKVLIECGAETIEPAALRQLIRQSMTLGIDETLKRLAPA